MYLMNIYVKILKFFQNWYICSKLNVWSLSNSYSTDIGNHLSFPGNTVFTWPLLWVTSCFPDYFSYLDSFLLMTLSSLKVLIPSLLENFYLQLGLSCKLLFLTHKSNCYESNSKKKHQCTCMCCRFLCGMETKVETNIKIKEIL